MQIESRTAFDLTDEQRQIGALGRGDRAARDRAAHRAVGSRAHVSARAVHEARRAGIMGLLVPEAYGGAGADYVSYALAIEEIARVDAGAAVTVSVHSMICSAILKLGSEEQKRRWLPLLAQRGHDRRFRVDRVRTRDRMPRRSRATARARRRSATCSTAASSGAPTAVIRGVLMGMFRTGGTGRERRERVFDRQRTRPASRLRK